MELIDKAALVTGLKKMIDDYWSDSENTWGIYPYALEEAIKYANTLEVKEVDFEKELDRIWFDNKLGNYFDNDAIDFAHIRIMCKHFFELGLKAKSMLGNDDSNPSYKEALKFIEDNTQVRYYEDRDSEGFRRGLDLEKEFYVKPNIAKEAVEIAMGHKKTD